MVILGEERRSDLRTAKTAAVKRSTLAGGSFTNQKGAVYGHRVGLAVLGLLVARRAPTV